MKPTIRRILSLVIAMLTVMSLATVGGVAAEEQKPIKNIIVMIPDGGGFGNLDLAEAVKKAGGIDGARTPITTDTIEGETHEGLYLSDYLVALTMTRSADDDVTDSAAGGTAIATGNRTNNSTVSMTPDGIPVASIMEAAQMHGKTIGMVTTCYYFDATPASFTSHAEDRGDYADITRQMMSHGLSFMLGGGEAYTAPDKNGNKISAEEFGYTVVDNAEEMNSAIDGGATKLWGNFHTHEAIDDNNLDRDIITDSDDPTILEMTKAAFKLLENIDDEDGFCIMIEGSLVDKSAHGSDAPEVAGEFLAFDEAFAYAVNWAKKDGETVVVALPDHDTGGLDVPDLEAGVSAVQNRENPSDFVWNGNGDHTGQDGGIWLYAPDGYREQFLEAIGVPTNGTPDDVRSGRFYSDFVANPDYQVKNCDVVEGIEAVCGIDLETANEELFTKITVGTSYDNGVYTVKESGIQFKTLEGGLTLPDGTVIDLGYGVNVISKGRPPKIHLPKAYLDMLERSLVTYSDVTDKNEWYYDAVFYANVLGLMNGTVDGMFSPLDSMTRAQLVTILWRQEGAPEVEYSDIFTDLKEDWYKNAVIWAADNGIVNGVGDGLFDPDGELTREQLATILYRYTGEYNGEDVSEKGDLTVFPDADKVSMDWAYDAVVWAVGRGLISGTQENGGPVILAPGDFTNRAQVATIMKRYNA